METTCDVVIVGGGPAGATLASLLSRGGLDVVVVEKERMPRYHIGESLIPQVLDILERSGALPEVEKAGFLRKEGGVFRWGSSDAPWSFYFDEIPNRYKHVYAYQVVRSQFDAILLDHAVNSGARVVQGFMAREFSIVENERVQVAGDGFQVTARLAIDCTGQTGWLARRFGLRQWDEVLKNVALFAYFEEAARMEGRNVNGIFCEAVEDGWLWNIPLHDGTNSVGLVTRDDALRGRKGSNLDLYEAGVALSTYTMQALRNARRVTEVCRIADYSFTSKRLWGPGYLIVGDAGNFVDPVWSTGVFLALQGAEWAANAILSWWQCPSDEHFVSYQKQVDELVGSYRDFIHYFYAQHCASPEAYFWKAYQIVENAVDEHDAFIRLVSGRLKG